ncbi:hypothetical protein [Moorena sp. SIO3I6]|uniref:hypothetical protein n=1 Tax=Moorena sp. SIO3I6 TaxID=2607831 RepID=UPI0013F7D9C1|nr:hypothetical protein [Moorena sp. SIO3I6]NEP27057.1 hypothetical protein [Moorena sp. SIO3I6]
MWWASCLPEAEYRQDACSTPDAPGNETGKMPVPHCICVLDSRFPIPDSRFPIPNSLLPVP